MQEKTLNQPMLERVQNLKVAIQGRCHHLPPSRLNQIITKIDPTRRYFIQATRNPQKFLNITAAESIDTADQKVISETTSIYGDFTPGRFVNRVGVKHIIAGKMDETVPAAALKSTWGNRYFPDATVSYTLVIYEPIIHKR